MTFTESDATNDGLIKREVGREMAKVAKTQNPQMFQHFEKVCEEVGRAPSEVFGEMCVRALDNEQYAHNVLNSEVNMGQIKADEIRLEDVKYVKQLSEELGLNETEDSNDPIDKLINQRLEMVTQSPLDNLRNNRENPEGVNGEVLSHMESLQREIETLKGEIEGDNAEVSTEDTSASSGSKSVDDLFGEGSQQDEQTEEDDYGEDEGPETVSVEEAEPEPEPEQETDDEPSKDEVDEALEGTGGSVDDVWEDGELGEGDVEDEEFMEMDPRRAEDDGDEIDDVFVTSEDGEEE